MIEAFKKAIKPFYPIFPLYYKGSLPLTKEVLECIQWWDVSYRMKVYQRVYGNPRILDHAVQNYKNPMVPKICAFIDDVKGQYLRTVKDFNTPPEFFILEDTHNFENMLPKNYDHLLAREVEVLTRTQEVIEFPDSTIHKFYTRACQFTKLGTKDTAPIGDLHAALIAIHAGFREKDLINTLTENLPTEEFVTNGLHFANPEWN